MSGKISFKTKKRSHDGDKIKNSCEELIQIIDGSEMSESKKEMCREELAYIKTIIKK